MQNITQETAVKIHAFALCTAQMEISTKFTRCFLNMPVISPVSSFAGIFHSAQHNIALTDLFIQSTQRLRSLLNLLVCVAD